MNRLDLRHSYIFRKHRTKSERIRNCELGSMEIYVPGSSFPATDHLFRLVMVWEAEAIPLSDMLCSCLYAPTALTTLLADFSMAFGRDKRGETEG